MSLQYASLSYSTQSEVKKKKWTESAWTDDDVHLSTRRKGAGKETQRKRGWERTKVGREGQIQ